MRYAVFAILLLAIGGWIGFRLAQDPMPEDPITVIVTQLRTQALIEHERHIAVWYKACPDVPGSDPLMFVAWPGKLTYELPLNNVSIERTGTTLKVKTTGIRVDEPTLPTDTMDSVSTEPFFNLTNEQELINGEIRKASGIARYLASYYLKRDPTLYEAMGRELESLVLRVAGAVDAGVTAVEVEIPRPDPKLMPLPRIELCEGTRAAVNGFPFAKTEEGHLIPIAFRTKPREGEEEPKPQGTAIVYGVKKETPTRGVK